jgi:signal transduction histidine kinase
VIQEVLELYHEVAEDKDIALACTCEQVIWVRADRMRLRQIIANLLDNAIKYTLKGGRVELRASQQQRHVVLAVQDTGMGIPSHDLPYIWERLYRGDQSRSQRGLGLGLSLVSAIVKAHQGSIDVASTPGNGSVFTLRLPMS